MYNLYYLDVPVGYDQLQHVELTRFLAQKFNSYYKTEYFSLPKPLLSEGKKILNLRNPNKKMSKSDSNDKTRINIIDSKDEIIKKIQISITDSLPNITYDEKNRPGLSNLITIFSVLSGLSIDNVVEKYNV